MWMVDVFYQTMEELYSEGDLHNILVFTVITSSSILSVLGALKHVYTYLHRNGTAGKKHTLICHPVPETESICATRSDFGLEDHLPNLYVSHLSTSDNSFVLYSEKICQEQGDLLKDKDLKCLSCNQQAWVRYCVHGLCDSCCEKEGWCSAKNQHSSLPHTYLPRKSWSSVGSQLIDLSNQSLREVPGRLGFQCMKASSLNMSCNKLTHLPEHMALIRQLCRINLSFNCLSHIPAFFSSFHQLTSLDLRHNVLTFFPTSVLDLKTLHVLLLDHNKLKHIPQEIGKLHFLQELGLGSNLLMEVPPSLFSICCLRKIQLRKNSGLKSLPSEVKNCLSLEMLDLSHCKLRFLPTTIGNCSMLRRLKLTNNRLLWLPCEISQCYCLTLLDVSHNPLTSLPATLLYRSSSFILKAKFCNLVPQPKNGQKWVLMDKITIDRRLNGFPTLSRLAHVCIRQHDLDLGSLPIPLCEEILTYSSCFYCGSRNNHCSIRAIKHCLFPSNSVEFPFLFTFCCQHLKPESNEDTLAQLDNLIAPKGTKYFTMESYSSLLC